MFLLLRDSLQVPNAGTHRSVRDPSGTFSSFYPFNELCSIRTYDFSTPVDGYLALELWESFLHGYVWSWPFASFDSQEVLWSSPHKVVMAKRGRMRGIGALRDLVGGILDNGHSGDALTR